MPNFPKTRQKGMGALALLGLVVTAGLLVLTLWFLSEAQQTPNVDRAKPIRQLVLQLTATYTSHREETIESKELTHRGNKQKESKISDEETLTFNSTTWYEVFTFDENSLYGSGEINYTYNASGQSTDIGRVDCVTFWGKSWPGKDYVREAQSTKTEQWTSKGEGREESAVAEINLSLRSGSYSIVLNKFPIWDDDTTTTRGQISDDWDDCREGPRQVTKHYERKGNLRNIFGGLDWEKLLEQLKGGFKPNAESFVVSGSGSTGHYPGGSRRGTLQVSYTLSFNTEPEDVRIKIVNPWSDSEHVFKGKKMVIEAEAKVEPAKYENEVIWEIQDIQGSRKTIRPGRGKKVKITFDKLPSDNNQFGEKTIKAKVQGKQDQVSVRVFFTKDGKDNHEEKYPNWFYYWRQGVVAGLERFEYRPGGSYYDLATQKLYISDDAASNLIGGTVPLKKVVTKRDGTRCTPASIVISPTKGVDSVARVVAHELEHYQRVSDLRLGDYDGDRVATPIEEASPYCLNPIKSPNTHNLNVSDGTPGDDEVLAMAAEAEESRSKSRVRRNLDWACPGSQCKRNR